MREKQARMKAEGVPNSADFDHDEDGEEYGDEDTAGAKSEEDKKKQEVAYTFQSRSWT